MVIIPFNSWGHGRTTAQYQALVTGQQAMLDKAEIAQYWATESAAPGGSILNYTTESGPAFTAAQNVLIPITSDPSTVTVTITGINNAVAQQNLSLV